MAQNAAGCDIDAEQHASHSDAIEIPNGKWHPSFCSEDADIILCSNDNTLFRVHSHILKLASGWFRGMFTLPQGSPASAGPDIISLGENEDVIAGLLKMISAMESPALHSIDLVESILLAAEKYDMPGPVSIIRIALSSSFLEASPVRLYGIAYRRGWMREAKLASSRTLTLNLCDPVVAAELSAVDSTAVVQLILLHRRRKDVLKAFLDDAANFAANRTTVCMNCGSHVGNGQWLALKYSWVARMDYKPFGVALEATDLECEELRAVLEAQCVDCAGFLYEAATTNRNLRIAIAALPQVVELLDPVVPK
ncbi:hypothetical protein BKA93DRAFT_953 [Sparassis latifolia]